MSLQSVTQRVDSIEDRMSTLEELPARMDRFESQLLELREEMRGEFSALQTGLQAEIRAGDEETRRYMRVLHEDVIARFALLQEGRQTPGRRKAAGDPRREPKR